MKKYLKSIKFILVAFGVSAVAASFAAVQYWRQPAASKVPEAAANHYSPEEQSIVKELITVYRRMDTVQYLQMEGTIDIKDPEDTDNSLQADFRYYKRNQLLYYQLGETEMIQAKDMAITTNREARKIFLSPLKEVSQIRHLPIDTIVKLWQDDSYKVTKTIRENLSTVQFLCENHITCKELRISYDKTSGIIKTIYSRMTNLSDPLNRKMDREMTFSCHKWVEQAPDQQLFSAGTYVRKGADTWTPTETYKEYDVVSDL